MNNGRLTPDPVNNGNFTVRWPLRERVVSGIIVSLVTAAIICVATFAVAYPTYKANVQAHIDDQEIHHDSEEIRAIANDEVEKAIKPVLRDTAEIKKDIREIRQIILADRRKK